LACQTATFEEQGWKKRFILICPYGSNRFGDLRVVTVIRVRQRKAISLMEKICRPCNDNKLVSEGRNEQRKAFHPRLFHDMYDRNQCSLWPITKAWEIYAIWEKLQEGMVNVRAAIRCFYCGRISHNVCSFWRCVHVVLRCWTNWRQMKNKPTAWSKFHDHKIPDD
jgi:hypothetical protein